MFLGNFVFFTNQQFFPRVFRIFYESSRINESCLSQPAWTTVPKGTEHNIIVRIGESESEISSIKDCAGCIVLLKLTADRYGPHAWPLCSIRATSGLDYVSGNRHLLY